MKKRFLLFGIVLSIYFINFISAVNPVAGSFQYGLEVKYPAQDVIRQNTEYQFNFNVFNLSGYPQTNSSVSCIFRLYNSSGDTIIDGVSPVPFTSPALFSINVNGNNFSFPGPYSYLVRCNSSSAGGFASVPLMITPNGQTLDTPSAIGFLGILFLFILFLIGGIYGISRSDGAWLIGYFCLSYLSLFSIFFIAWNFSLNYLWQISIISSIFWALWITMLFCFLPFLIGISLYIIKRGVQDNLMKEYMGQGFSREEAHEMSKRKR